jgi:2'-hydroxyisoflavone reductase
MRLLILGGTWFLGRTLATDALARGWDITAFSRGRSGYPPPGATHVRGDRTSEDDLKRLVADGPWDATIDTSAFEPADVTRVLGVLGKQTGRYVLISTVSAYRDWPNAPVSESSPLWPSRADYSEGSPELAEMSEPHRYGTLKAGCEAAAIDGSAEHLIVRPGVILGPGEYVGRGLKLLERAARGGRWLLPAPPEHPIQPIDVRDVSAFLLDGIEKHLSGAFNLVAPAAHSRCGELVDVCLELTGRQAAPVWADPAWLLEQGVGQWTEMPLWRTAAGTWNVDGSRAAQAGLSCRPLRETLRDFKTAFDRDGLIDHPRQQEHGMDPEREARVLAAWDEQVSSRAGQSLS